MTTQHDASTPQNTTLDVVLKLAERRDNGRVNLRTWTFQWTESAVAKAKTDNIELAREVSLNHRLPQTVKVGIIIQSDSRRYGSDFDDKYLDELVGLITESGQLPYDTYLELFNRTSEYRYCGC